MDLQLSGKNAIVTGASRGIGKAIARALAEEGVQVVIAARGLQALQRTAEELTAETGTQVVAFAADTGDDASVNALVENAIGQFGHIDILVNNAATPATGVPIARIADVTGERLLDDVNIKVGGYLRTARALAPYLLQNGWGRIINIGGLAARKSGNYVACVRNAGVTSITKNLADELAPGASTSTRSIRAPPEPKRPTPLPWTGTRPPSPLAASSMAPKSPGWSPSWHRPKVWPSTEKPCRPAAAASATSTIRPHPQNPQIIPEQFP